MGVPCLLWERGGGGHGLGSESDILGGRGAATRAFARDSAVVLGAFVPQRRGWCLSDAVVLVD